MFFATLLVWAVAFISIVLGLGLMSLLVIKVIEMFKEDEKSIEEKEDLDK